MSESELEPIYISDGTVINAHKRIHCTEPCPLHAPSKHHMITWPLHWRTDRSIFERTCIHGIGHPDPDTIAYLKKEHGEELAASEAVHGCDGCCKQRH